MANGDFDLVVVREKYLDQIHVFKGLVNAIDDINSCIALKVMIFAIFQLGQDSVCADIDSDFRKEVCETLGIQKSEIVRALKILKSKDILCQKETHYYINPRYFLRGNPSCMQKAIKMYDEIRDSKSE